LISVLNAAFPDYDFSNASAKQFRKESSQYMVVNSINTALSNVIQNYEIELAPKLWSAIDTEICLKDCDIYSYMPDIESDPFSEDGTPPAIWSFHYFFYNKKLKRIIYYAVYAVSKNVIDINSNPYLDDEGAWMAEDSIMEL